MTASVLGVTIGVEGVSVGVMVGVSVEVGVRVSVKVAVGASGVYVSVGAGAIGGWMTGGCVGLPELPAEGRLQALTRIAIRNNDRKDLDFIRASLGIAFPSVDFPIRATGELDAPILQHARMDCNRRYGRAHGFFNAAAASAGGWGGPMGKLFAGRISHTKGDQRVRGSMCP